jgi:hypothetical protein
VWSFDVEMVPPSFNDFGFTQGIEDFAVALKRLQHVSQKHNAPMKLLEIPLRRLIS